ncbi:snoaL-likedomain-containing protein [Cordyceps javanica]|uniref:SnoaL-likedomain-containing protein n=1 Tax=Cordyceps javanica TaxID=43265 RepID=A0A545VJX1_9HYPO|nr:snoaL-likedomain-containing protein [Cordyceps javanica]TQW01999.1 snoaL-like domain-containing protein [Cordyceps javanica]
MSFSISAQLSPTPSDREAVVDCIARCVCGLDTADRALFRSAFTADAVFDLNGAALRGLDAITTSCFDIVSRLDTTHMTSNVRTTFAEGGRAATATATGVAHHYRAGRGLAMERDGLAGRLVVGSLYSIDLVKVDEAEDGSGGGALWKAKTWRLKSVWSEGDWAVMGALPGNRGTEGEEEEDKAKEAK